MLATKPDAAIVDGKLCIYVGGDYKMLSPDVAHEYVRKLQGLDAKLQRSVKRAAKAKRTNQYSNSERKQSHEGNP